LFRTSFNQVSFDSRIGLSYVNPFSITELKSTERNWRTIEKRTEEGNIGTITYGSLNPKGRGFQVGVSFSFYSHQPFISGNEAFTSPNLVTFWVDRFRLEDGITSISTCIELMKSIWEFAGGVYGNADYFISHYTGAVNSQQKLAAASYFNAKLLTTSHPPTHLNMYHEIPDIYWLNFLGEQHVKGLLDNEISKRALSGFTVQELSHGGLGILLAPSPFVAEQENLQNSCRLLRAALAPLLKEGK
jgi:hypothetical protein